MFSVHACARVHESKHVCARDGSVYRSKRACMFMNVCVFECMFVCVCVHLCAVCIYACVYV